MAFGFDRHRVQVNIQMGQGGYGRFDMGGWHHGLIRWSSSPLSGRVRVIARPWRKTIRSDCGRAKSSVQWRAVQITRSAGAPGFRLGAGKPDVAAGLVQAWVQSGVAWSSWPIRVPLVHRQRQLLQRGHRAVERLVHLLQLQDARALAQGQDRAGTLGHQGALSGQSGAQTSAPARFLGRRRITSSGRFRLSGSQTPACRIS